MSQKETVTVETVENIFLSRNPSTMAINHLRVCFQKCSWQLQYSSLKSSSFSSIILLVNLPGNRLIFTHPKRVLNCLNSKRYQG